ncbi:hypothetical protein [Streptomyces sp. NPDC097619]|uniref:hypothetical protein n=1 Tax=Streptomyces sp. NPDC097619 TaxID=3157228 RepID=UPI00331DE3FA
MKKIAVFATAAVVVGLTGCSGSGEPEANVGPVKATKPADPSAAARTALDRASSTALTSGSAELASTSVHGGRTLSDPAQAVVWEGHGPAEQSGTIDGTASFGKGIHVIDSDGRLPYRRVEEILYYQVDKPIPGHPGKTWFKEDQEKSPHNSAGSFDIRDTLRELTELKDVSVVRKETVAGKATTHYRGHLDHIPGPAGDPALAQVTKRIVDVWIGDAGTPVKILQTVGPDSETMLFKAFGNVAPILVPPAAETVSTKEYRG